MIDLVDGRNLPGHPEARLHRFGSFCDGGSKWPGRAIPWDHLQRREVLDAGSQPRKREDTKKADVPFVFSCLRRCIYFQQPEAAGLGDGRRSGRDIELREGIGDVPVDRVLADEEALGYRLIVQAGRNQLENLDLSWRQALPVLRTGQRSCRARRQLLEHRASANDLEAGAERCQIVDRETGLGDGGFWTPEGSQYTGELHARAAGLERRAALLE